MKLNRIVRNRGDAVDVLLGVIAIGVVLFVLAVLVKDLFFNVHTTPGSGEKIGQITRASEDGIVFKTYEAEIIRGGFSGGSGVNGAAFHFTIPTKELFIQTQVYMEKRTEVIITYDVKFVSTKASGSGVYLTSIRPAAER